MVVFNSKSEEESCALICLWFEIDKAIKFVNDHFADDQTKANSFSINMILLVFDTPEKFENLAAILFLYTYAVVNDMKSQELSGLDDLEILIIKKQFNLDFYTSTHFGKFDGIWDQIEQNLLQTFLIWFYNKAMIFKTLKLCPYLYIFIFHLVLLNFKNLINGVSDVEAFHVLFEVLLVFVQNSVVKNIVYKKVDEFGCRSYLFSWIFQTFIQWMQILF